AGYLRRRRIDSTNVFVDTATESSPQSTRSAQSERLSTISAVSAVNVSSADCRLFWLGFMFHDIRLAFRALRSTPVVSLIAILSLALGIGANTAIFSLVDSLILRALPVKEPGQLVMLSDEPGARVASTRGITSWTN